MCVLYLCDVLGYFNILFKNYDLLVRLYIRIKNIMIGFATCGFFVFIRINTYLKIQILC